MRGEFSGLARSSVKLGATMCGGVEAKPEIGEPSEVGFAC